MGVSLPRRALYRVRQFVQAVRAPLAPLTEAERSQARALLPKRAWPLFAAMAVQDQRHSFRVLESLQAAGYREPALLQAALLHDCAKRAGGVRLWHRVAMVLIKAVRPGLPARWRGLPAPRAGSWRYPFWAHANHAAQGAVLAGAAGCDPQAIWLIQHHQDPLPGPGASAPVRDRLLAALHAADDDN